MKNSTIKVLPYFELLRPHHWIKNILVFIPILLDTSQYFNISLIANTILGFICFSLLSSCIYIFNDIRDIEKDRLHIKKCLRPLPSGKLSVSNAKTTLIVLLLFLTVLLVILGLSENIMFNINSISILLLYALLNVAYSLKLKNIPIVDVTILASGYVIRVLFGAMIIGVEVSVWLYLFMTMGAYFLGFGKRRNEMIENEKETREVMRFYTHNFLDKNMYVCMTLCMVFYALWSIDSATIERYNTTIFIYTVPFVFVILLKYSLNVESNTEGDPTSIILNDKILLSLCAIYIACIFSIIYLDRAVV